MSAVGAKKQNSTVDPPGLFATLPFLLPAVGTALFPRLPFAEKAVKDLVDLLRRVASTPAAAPHGSYAAPKSIDVKWKDLAKKGSGLALYALLVQLAFNAHMLMPRRTYDGGTPPDAAVDMMTVLFMLSYLIESLTGVDVDQGIIEGITEALAEAFEILLVNPLTKFYSLYFGLENADDDEIKDIANAQVISNDSMAYLSLLSGLSNLATIAEIATGYSYALENNVRPLLREAENFLTATLEQRRRLWTWGFNRITAEITELITTAGQIAQFAVQRIREVARKGEQFVSDRYYLLLELKNRYEEARAAGDVARAEQLLNEMDRVYSIMLTVYNALVDEVGYAYSMASADFAKLDGYLENLKAKFEDYMKSYEHYVRSTLEKIYALFDYAVEQYKRDMREIIETIASYRSERPRDTAENFEFTKSIETLPEGEEYGAGP